MSVPIRNLTDTWNDGGTIFLYSNVLRAILVPEVDWFNVPDWRPIADGMDRDITVCLKVFKGDVTLAYTPTFSDNPESYKKTRFPSGDIYTSTKNQVIWIKPVDPKVPITASGRIVTYPYQEIPRRYLNG